MRKVMIIFSIVIIYFILYFLHVNFFSWFTIAGVMPNLIVLLVLFIGLFINSKVGAVMGFFIGLYTDFLFSQNIGCCAFLMMAVGYIGGYLDKKFSKESKMTIILIGSIVTAVYEIVMHLYRMIAFSVELNFWTFLWTLAIELLYNALLIIILYPAIQKAGFYAENEFENKSALPRYF